MLTAAFFNLFTALCLSGVAHAAFQVQCTKPLVVERVDPLISFGYNPSNHVHVIHGANDYNGNSTYESLRTSTCTSCTIKEDKSTYWYPGIYFHDPTTKTFEQVADKSFGMYYSNGPHSIGQNNITYFPKGFKMYSGSPVYRSHGTHNASAQEQLREKAASWQCVQKDGSITSGYGFPKTDCKTFVGLVQFPGCWNGVSVDPADHASHIAYLSELDRGSCPSTHPIHLPILSFKTTWDLTPYSHRWNASTGWPFVYATGDPTGYSWHGDFFNGWDEKALKNAVNKCNFTPAQQAGDNKACKYLTPIPASQATRCKIPNAIPENVNGPLKRLPGCNPLQYGPQDSTQYGLFGANDCPLKA